MAISLLTEPIRTEQPPPPAGKGHAARQIAAMRQSQGVDGTGVGIGVLSTGVAALVSGEAAVQLLDRVMVLPGQAGEGDDGTKTLALLHDLAPGADLYFATGLGGPRRFATNLQALCQAGADIIVDDLFDYRETIYPGGRMAWGIQAAVTEGCVYVSAAGKRIESGVLEDEHTPEESPGPLEDFSAAGDRTGSLSDLSSATCLTVANPDLETFCGSSGSPRQVAALAALILEAAAGAHNAFPEQLRAAVAGGELGIEPEATPLAETPGPVVRRVENSSNPPQGQEAYGIGGPLEATVTNPAIMKRTAEGTWQRGGQLSAKTERQIQALLAAKARRTTAQRKLSSQLLDAGRMAQRKPVATEAARRQALGEAPRDELVAVDIRADVTPEVLARIRVLGGTIVNSVPKYRAIRARLPLTALEPLATLEAVQSIRPADRAVTNQTLGRAIGQAVVVTSKENTTEGDVAHEADVARQDYGVDGTGIGIGVLSDGIDSLADRQATGDLPARVTVLPGQAGSGDEGTAMLEIVHDLAPGAELYFAEAFHGGQAQFAANIEALCEAGADVIVDDVIYLREPAFQDGIVAQGVNAAVANGCIHFSAAGNAGNLTNETSGVWEGDFVEGAEVRDDNGVLLGHRHDFGGDDENTITALGLAANLQWADPLEASANDYDLFVLNEDGTVFRSATDIQDGTQDPIEFISAIGLFGLVDFRGKRLAIVRIAGAEDRYLRLSFYRGQLDEATGGQTFGHAAAENGIGVGMVDVSTAGGADDVFDGTESVHENTSDGPRRIFFEPEGTPITRNDFSSSGGKVLQKPDLSAATCVSTATPGYSTFCGTSAAAPHAAGIAALVLEAAGGPANVTLAALRAALTGAALDIEATGVDRDSGAGIVMTPDAVDAEDLAVADRNRAPTVTSAPADQSLAPGGAPATLDLTSVFSDPDSDDLTYTVISSHPGFVGASVSGTTLTVIPVAPRLVAVTVREADPEGLSAVATFNVVVSAGTTDYDTDDDDLIEVANLAQLHAVRYDLNGDALLDVAANWPEYDKAFPQAVWDMGCPNGCGGYELKANLDFDTNSSGGPDAGDTYWNEGAGWMPIGDLANPFAATFAGNGYTLANLFIDRPQDDEVGLFSRTYFGSTVRQVGLVNVQVTGDDRVGGLVGENFGTITASYATGAVTGDWFLGGLVGENFVGTIRASYTTGRVSGSRGVGGLVGENSGTITASYATGAVTGQYRVGGLVGDNTFGRITASYATGSVGGGGVVGGLVGDDTAGITASYWDTSTSGQVSGDHGEGRTTVELQAPTGYSGIYADWNLDVDGDRMADNPWQFGTDAQYPALAVDFDGDGDATWTEFGYQLRTGPTLTAMEAGGQVELSWTEIDVSHWNPEPAVTYTLYRAVGSTVTVLEEDFSGTTYTTPDSILPYTYQVAVVVDGGEPVRSGRVTAPNRIDYDPDDDGLIEVTNLAQLDALRYDLEIDGVADDASDWLTFYTAFPKGAPSLGCSNGCLGYELTADLDFDTNGSGGADAGDTYWNGGRRLDADRARWALVPCDPGGQRAYAGQSVHQLARTSLLRIVRCDRVRQRHPPGRTGQRSGDRRLRRGYAGWEPRRHDHGQLRDRYGRGPGRSGRAGRPKFRDDRSELRNSDRGWPECVARAPRLRWRAGGGQRRRRDRGELRDRFSEGQGRRRGLVGVNDGGTITASYATGTVTGEDDVGGLVGDNDGTTTASYWDTSTSGHPTGFLGFGMTTAQLQTPTGYSGIYADWNVDLDNDGTGNTPWHFGTDAQYPALKADFDESGTATWQEFGHQLREGPTLTATAGPTQIALSWTAVEASHWSPAPAVAYTLYRDDGVTVEAIAENLASLTYTDTGLTAGATYSYQAAAVVTDGEATRSAWVPVTVEPDTPAPTVTLELTPSSIGENGGSSRVTASLDRVSSEETTVTVSATPVAPAVSADFTLSANKRLTIAAGQTASTGTVTITANNNGVDAPDKTVRVTGTASNSQGVTDPSEVTLTITDDDDALPNMWLDPTESDPMVSVGSAATYSVTFQGSWTTTVTSDGLPSGAHFTTLIGGVHNAGVTFLREGGMAGAGVELMAELGGTSTLAAEVRAAEPSALGVLQGSGGNISPTGSSTINPVTLTSDHPRVTLLTMVAPSPDWFVGVSGLSLLDAQGDWLASRSVNLYPWDAGTEEGTEFSLSNPATSPQGAITSLRGKGKFSNAAIAT